MKIMVINGPNLNIPRDPEFGRHEAVTSNNINERLAQQAEELGISCEFFRGNDEGELVTLIQNAWGAADGVILNAGDYSHYSIAIRDAIASINKPVVEVHLTNVHAQEEFHHESMLSAVCKGTISGFGLNGYFLALHALASEFGFKTGNQSTAK